MELYEINFETNVLLLTLVSGTLAGIVKGIVGFAMPMILMSCLAMFVPIHTAIAALILPTIITNCQQAHEQGLLDSFLSLKQHKLFFCVMALVTLASAKIAPHLPQQSLVAIIGILIISFSLFHMSGFTFKISSNSARSKVALGTLAGFAGGICGAFGPSTVAYLTALNTEKNEQMKVQAAIFGIGAIFMLGGHSMFGIFNLSTAPISAFLIFPCMFGYWIGAKVRKRLNQDFFRLATLLVLLFVGGNLIRRDWFM